MVRTYGFLGFIFQREMSWTRATVPWTGGMLGAVGPRSSPVAAGEEEGGEAGPRGCSLEHSRWLRGGNKERRWLELDAGAEECDEA
jgi:hypothetical protein